VFNIQYTTLRLKKFTRPACYNFETYERQGAVYCDDHVCVAACLSVRLSIERIPGNARV